MSDEEKKELLAAIDDLDFKHEQEEVMPEHTADEKESDDKVGETAKTDDSKTEDEKSKEAGESKKSEEEDISDGKEKKGEEDKTGEKTSDEEDPSKKISEKTEDKDEKGAEASEDVDESSQVDILLKEINRLSGMVGQPVAVVKEEEKPAGDKEEKADKKSEVADSDFIGDLDMDDVASDPKVLNTILNKVLQKGVELGKSLTTDQTNLNIPQMVRDQVTHVASFKDMIDEFYKENSDLSNVRAVVKACASQIIGENPKMLWTDVLNKAAESTRKTLGFKKPEKSEEDKASSDTSSAAFADAKGGNRKGKGQKGTKLQQELDELY